MESNADFGKAQQHFMHTSWPSKPQSEWSFPQRLFAWLNVLPNFPDQPHAPVKKIGDPVPVLRKRSQVISVAPWCIAPILAHYAYMKFTGLTLHPAAAYVLYMWTYYAYSGWTTRVTTYIGQKYGHLDGEKPRDGVPDALDWHVLTEVLKVIVSCNAGGLLPYLIADDRAPHCRRFDLSSE